MPAAVTLPRRTDDLVAGTRWYRYMGFAGKLESRKSGGERLVRRRIRALFACARLT